MHGVHDLRNSAQRITPSFHPNGGADDLREDAGKAGCGELRAVGATCIIEGSICACPRDALYLELAAIC